MKLHFLAILLTSSMMTGCITSSALPQQQRPQQWGDLIQKSSNFYQMSDSIFRSEQPNAQLIPLLKEHQIDVVINLRSRDQDSTTLAGKNLKLIHIPIHTWALDKYDLLQVMQNIQTAQQQNQKVLIHCYHGSDRTGASIAMYRIIFENWSTEAALNEMKHGGYGFHPIWVNIDKQFSPENIKWIRDQLTNPSM